MNPRVASPTSMRLDENGVPLIVQSFSLSPADTIDMLLFDGSCQCMTFEDFEKATGVPRTMVHALLCPGSLPVTYIVLEVAAARLYFPDAVGSAYAAGSADHHLFPLVPSWP